MNRLKLQRFYLVGPMDHDRESGREWREDMSEWLFSRKAIPLNPYYKPLLDEEDGLEDDDNYKKRVEAQERGDWDELARLTVPVIRTDLRMVDHCDAIIVNMDLEKYPCGTWDEMFTAINQKKPVIVHAAQTRHKLPHWMFARFNHQMFFDTWEDLKNYLDDVDQGEEVENFNRWKFFDYEPLVLKALNLQQVPNYQGG